MDAGSGCGADRWVLANSTQPADLVLRRIALYSLVCRSMAAHAALHSQIEHCQETSTWHGGPIFKSRMPSWSACMTCASVRVCTFLLWRTMLFCGGKLRSEPDPSVGAGWRSWRAFSFCQVVSFQVNESQFGCIEVSLTSLCLST